ncbi:MAG: hypothetical protein MJK14_23955 [Rivularia sp. ALOHA_DT_140]|nr:hypothetical protein [Rivularia sp. ALOHA_DT_140]
MKQATQVMLWVEKITSIVYEHDHTYFTIEMPMQEVNYTGRIPSKYALFLEDYKPEVYTVWIEGSLSYDNDLPLVDAKKMRFVPKENNQTIMGIEL